MDRSPLITNSEDDVEDVSCCRRFVDVLKENKMKTIAGLVFILVLLTTTIIVVAVAQHKGITSPPQISTTPMVTNGTTITDSPTTESFSTKLTTNSPTDYTTDYPDDTTTEEPDTTLSTHKPYKCSGLCFPPNMGCGERDAGCKCSWKLYCTSG